MLINCVVYERGVRLRDIGIDEIPAFLGRPGAFVWVALRDPDDDEVTRLQQQFNLHELAIEDTREGHQRPKVEEYGEVIFAVMHVVEPSETPATRHPDDEEGAPARTLLRCGELSVFLGPDFVLSVRRRSMRSFLGVRARCEREPELLALGPGYVFYALMDAVVDAYLPVLDALEAELESIEESIFERGAQARNVKRLYSLKRRATVLRHAVGPLVDAINRLHGGRVPVLVQRVGEYFRDVHDHALRVQQSVEALRETINTAIQVNLSMVSIEQSEVGKRLAAWAAIFAVLTAFAGIWGMNFEHMPELDWKLGYPLALSLMAGTAGLLYRRFRRAGWL